MANITIVSGYIINQLEFSMIDHLDKPVYFKLSCIAVKYKSRIGDTKELLNIGCIPLRWSGSGSVMRDHLDHSTSKELASLC